MMTTSPEQQTLLVLENYIGGKFVACQDHIDSYDPSTGQVYCRVPDSAKDEVRVPLAVTYLVAMYIKITFIVVTLLPVQG